MHDSAPHGSEDILLRLNEMESLIQSKYSWGVKSLKLYEESSLNEHHSRTFI